jgi:hypothetical protein
MAEFGTLAAFAVGLFPEASAPARFAQLLAEVVPDWRVEPPESDAVDLHITATDPTVPAGFGSSVSITVDWPAAAGYRDIDEWLVTGYGPHRVGVEMRLYHDASREEFDIVLRLLRAVWAE